MEKLSLNNNYIIDQDNKNKNNKSMNKTHKKCESINYNDLTMEIIEEKNEIKEEEKSNKENNKCNVKLILSETKM